MAQPELRGYHRLPLVEALPADLVDRALQDAAIRWPEWTPREGDTAVVLIEVLSTVISELNFAVNRVPPAVTEILIRLFGIERNLGVAPTATLTFALANTLGHTIPAGTRALLSLGGSLPDVEFRTDTSAIAAAGTSSIDVAATATIATADANGTPAGTSLELISAIPYVDAVTLATAVAAGADPEEESAWRDRAVTRFSRLVSTLVLPEHFTADALDWPTVARATTIDLYDPGQAGAPGDHGGHVTVAVAGSAGALLAAADKASLEASLEEKTLANLDVHIVDPTITAVDVNVEVVRRSNYSSAQVITNVTDALTAYLDPDAWDWDAIVYRNELIALVDSVEGVDRVVNIVTPAGDLALPGDAPLATIGVVTVTVQAP